MDRGSIQTLAVDANSVGSSFANLELNPSPINRLPNKLLQRVLSKVQRMVPIKKFARLRSVDTRWRSAVDGICKEKKSLLLIVREMYLLRNVKGKDLFCGLLGGTDFRCVIIEPNLYFDEDDHVFVFANDTIFGSLLKALPNIEQLFIYCPDSDGIDEEFATYITSLGSLKKLYLEGDFESLFYLSGKLRITLSQLEFFFLKKLDSIFNELFFVRFIAINFDYVRQLHARNPRWLGNVNQLSFPVGLNDQSDQVVHFLQEHATLLNVLYIKFCDTTQITPELFGHLAKLTRLTEIALGPVQFEVLKQVAKAIELDKSTPLSTITTCNLVISDFRSVTGHQFTRFLLAIFPNVVNWNFAFAPKALESFITHLKQNSNFNYSTHPNVRQLKIIDRNVDEFFKILNVFESFSFISTQK